MKKSLCVIGCGAAGIVAAIKAAKNGFSVTILEQAEKPLKKLAVTCSGRCNLSNKLAVPGAFRGHDTTNADRIVERYPREVCLDFFYRMGILTKEIDGYYFPANESAASVVRILLAEAARNKIKIKTNEEVQKIEKEENRFFITTGSWKYEADIVITACGSPASVLFSPETFLTTVSADFDLQYYDFLPALTSLYTTEAQKKGWPIARADGAVSIYVDEKFLASKDGEIQFSRTGLGGMPSYSVGRYAIAALENKQNVYAVIDLLYHRDLKQVEELLQNMMSPDAGRTLTGILSGILPERLAQYLAEAFKDQTPDVQKLIEAMRNIKVRITGYPPNKEALTCQGGIALTSLSEHLEALHCPGLYFIGEAVDIDAPCGGYSLQWAWSSALCVAEHIISEVKA